MMTGTFFGNGAIELKPDLTLHGGKGASLLAMHGNGLNVPPGFIIGTDWHKTVLAYSDHVNATLDDLKPTVESGLAHIDQGKDYSPLVSVRSGAPVSMPGMMDTILNVGITDDNVGAYAAILGERTAWDCLRRLYAMMGETAYGIPKEQFEKFLVHAKGNAGVTVDSDLSTGALAWIVSCYRDVYSTHGKSLPTTRGAQIRDAIAAVWASWNTERAILYRTLHNLPSNMGTACVVQAMVFGNMNDRSCTGVLFSRNPSTGEPGMVGEYLINAQGEDVVAGIRTPAPIGELLTSIEDHDQWEALHGDLADVCSNLEEVYSDCVDIEFTVEDGTLYLLQCRAAKRSALAAFKIAHTLFSNGTIEAADVIARLTPAQLKACSRPIIDPTFDVLPAYTGLPACPGVVQGVAAFSSEDAVKMAADGLDVILVTHETTPDDLHGMNAAIGILTSTGGATSHAAVVARAMDKPCVVGTTYLDVGLLGSGSGPLKVAIDGATGRVWIEQDVPVIDATGDPSVAFVLRLVRSASGFALPVSWPDFNNPAPQRICASHWWDDDAKFDALMKALAGKCGDGRFTLDITAPKDLCVEDDTLLCGCFGLYDQGASFQGMMLGRLQSPDYHCAQGSNAGKSFAHGLVIAGSWLTGKDKAHAEKLGLVLPSTNAPAKTLADFLAGDEANEAFISDVLGGQAAFEKIKHLAAAKTSVSLLPAQPPVYLTYLALSGDHVPASLQGA